MILNEIEENSIAKCKLVCQRLKLAVLIFVTLRAIGPVLGKKKFNDMLTGIPYFQGVSVDIHALRYGHCTGGYKCPGTRHLDHANPAVSRNTKIGMIA